MNSPCISTSISLYIINKAQTGITLMSAVPSYTRVSTNVSWPLEGIWT
eukprot:UN24804